MKFDIPKITKVLRLADYDPAWGGLEIRVWVNPPERLLNGHDRLVEDVNEALKGAMIAAGEQQTPMAALALKAKVDQAADGLVKVFSELWSQGEPDTRWTEEEIRTLVAETRETDPRLWMWMRNQSIQKIKEHRDGIKKG